MSDRKLQWPRRDFVKLAAAAPLIGASSGLIGTLGQALAKGAAHDPDAAIRAAFYYGYPLYEFARTEQTLGQALNKPGKINQLTTRAKLSTYQDKVVTAPNNDTIYSSCFLDLSAGPIEVVSPSMDRYFSIAFMDAFTDNFAYIGTRATGGKGGRFWVAGPQWRGKAPAGVTLFRSSTNDVWMLARILVDGPDDLAAATALQAQIKVVVPDGRPAGRGYTHQAVKEEGDPANFLAVVNEVLKRSPGHLGQTARAGRFAALGIGTDRPPSDAVLAAWAKFLPTGFKDLREGFLFRDLVKQGWSYQPRGVGNFGTNDRLRAIVALGGIAALGEQEAMYFHANFDIDGERLSGANAYRWRVPAGGVPAKAFWSLTMYDALPDGRYFLVQNPIERYSIGDRTPGLIKDADGSLDIILQHEPPKGPLAANWLPAPTGPMRLALRAYMPKDVLINRQWRVPPLEKIQPM